jgi:hypothetical protein
LNPKKIAGPVAQAASAWREGILPPSNFIFRKISEERKAGRLFVAGWTPARSVPAPLRGAAKAASKAYAFRIFFG